MFGEHTFTEPSGGFPETSETTLDMEITSTDLEFTGVVSLWLGDFDSELELDDYLHISKGFEADFGFKIDPNRYSRGEYAIPSEERDISQLLDGFFLSSHWKEAAIQAANSLGWTKAKTALVHHHLKYDPDLIRCDSDAPMTFIGTFPCTD